MEEDTVLLLRSETELGINLRMGKESLEAGGVAAEVKLRHGSVIEEILREVHEGNYDLVVTGTALSRSLRTYALGDVGRELVNRAHRPVLVVRTQVKGRSSHFGLGRWFSKSESSPSQT